jgi:hypothetical protein
VGKKYSKSGAQVALAWGIAHGRSVIPKSKTPARIEQNVEGDFELSAEDIKKIDAIDRKLRFNDPSENFGWNFYQDLEGKEAWVFNVGGWEDAVHVNGPGAGTSRSNYIAPVLSWNEVHINSSTWRVASNGPHMAIYPQIWSKNVYDSMPLKAFGYSSKKLILQNLLQGQTSKTFGLQQMSRETHYSRWSRIGTSTWILPRCSDALSLKIPQIGEVGLEVQSGVRPMTSSSLSGPEIHGDFIKWWLCVDALMMIAALYNFMPESLVPFGAAVKVMDRLW